MIGLICVAICAVIAIGVIVVLFGDFVFYCYICISKNRII